MFHCSHMQQRSKKSSIFHCVENLATVNEYRVNALVFIATAFSLIIV